MIKIENVVLPSPEQMMFVIQGLRNPLNSWDKSDSFECPDGACCLEKCPKYIPYDQRGEDYIPCGCEGEFILGNNDLSLMKKLSNAGTDHRKFMRMMPVMVRITAPLYWWKEFDTYKVGTVANSCSTMHKITEKKFTLDDFSTDHLCLEARNDLKMFIDIINCWRSRYINYDEDAEIGELTNMSKKDIWWQMIQLLPSSYNQTRNVMLNYEVLANIYPSRKSHKLDEWHKFCDWIENLPYSELITGGKHDE